MRETVKYSEQPFQRDSTIKLCEAISLDESLSPDIESKIIQPPDILDCTGSRNKENCNANRGDNGQLVDILESSHITVNVII